MKVGSVVVELGKETKKTVESVRETKSETFVGVVWFDTHNCLHRKTVNAKHLFEVA
jgi:hypothetical protein